MFLMNEISSRIFFSQTFCFIIICFILLLWNCVWKTLIFKNSAKNFRVWCFFLLFFLSFHFPYFFSIFFYIYFLFFFFFEISFFINLFFKFFFVWNANTFIIALIYMQKMSQWICSELVSVFFLFFPMVFFLSPLISFSI